MIGSKGLFLAAAEASIPVLLQKVLPLHIGNRAASVALQGFAIDVMDFALVRMELGPFAGLPLAVRLLLQVKGALSFAILLWVFLSPASAASTMFFDMGEVISPICCLLPFGIGIAPLPTMP